MHNLLNRKKKSKQKPLSSLIRTHHTKTNSNSDLSLLALQAQFLQKRTKFHKKLSNQIHSFYGTSPCFKYDSLLEDGIRDNFSRGRYSVSRKNKVKDEFGINKKQPSHKSTYCPIGVVRQVATQSVDKQNGKYGSFYLPQKKSSKQNGYQRKIKNNKTFYYFPKASPLEDPVTLQLSADSNKYYRVKHGRKSSKLKRTWNQKSNQNQKENNLSVEGSKSQWEIFVFERSNPKKSPINQNQQKKNRIIFPYYQYDV